MRRTSQESKESGRARMVNVSSTRYIACLRKLKQTTARSRPLLKSDPSRWLLSAYCQFRTKLLRRLAWSALWRGILVLPPSNTGALS